MIKIEIEPQPTDVTCGPTSLHAVYKYFGDSITLKQVIEEVHYLETGGTLAVMLASHALKRGYSARIYTYNLGVFDPTWFTEKNVDLRLKLREQLDAKDGHKLSAATTAYINFLDQGGRIFFRDLTPSLFKSFFEKKIPILTGLSSTYLYKCKREWSEEKHLVTYDDIKGYPAGHFVVLSGYNKSTKQVVVADPYEGNPISKSNFYSVDISRLINSIMLGIVTYDANLLIINLKVNSMQSIIVTNNPKDWIFQLSNVEVISANQYIDDPSYANQRNYRVYNLCRSYRYKSLGYYVSLLAEARGHRIFPSVSTIQDQKSQSIIRVLSDDIDHLIQKSLSKLKSKEFHLSIYFGKNVATQYDKLSKQLYNLFQAPLLSAQFVHHKKWILQNITLLQINEIPENHNKYFLEIANEYFSKKRLYPGKKINYLYDLAILVEQDEKNPPSNQWAINKFIDRAESHGFRTRVITKDDYSRIAEFDALFIRATTVVNHYTYRFARRATAEGLIVLDDPLSIIKCANKVYLAELLAKAKIKTPKTMIVHKENKHLVGETLGYPCVLKLPDSSFSHGVVKIENLDELKIQVENFLEESDLLVAQEFIQTEFDWRIGILNNQPFFACKYFMAKEHWQIYNWNSSQNSQGTDQAIALEEVPAIVLDTALKAANLIGNGLYGVDLKHCNDQVVIIEINDNPSIDHGIEDNLLKDNVYDTIIQYFVSEIQKKKL